MAVILQQIPSYQLGSTHQHHHHRYANIRSKIDQTDPNPAHKLKHSVEELTIKEGVEINPRFYNTKKQKSNKFLDKFPKSTNSNHQRRGNLNSYIHEGPRGFGSPPPRRFKAMEEIKEDVAPPSVRTKKPLHDGMFESIEEDKSVEEEEDIQVNSETSQPMFVSDAFTNSSSSSNNKVMDTSRSNSSSVAGMNVTSSGTGTTVVLRHVLPLSNNERTTGSSSNRGSMTIIEEDETEEEEEFYESKDSEPIAPESSGYRLPQFIPRLIVTDEEGELVVTVVDRARELSHTSLATTTAEKIPEEEEEEDEEERVQSTRL